MLQEADPRVPDEVVPHYHRVTPSSDRLDFLLATEIETLTSFVVACVDVLGAMVFRKPFR